jgi:hypothetical protein
VARSRCSGGEAALRPTTVAARPVGCSTRRRGLGCDFLPPGGTATGDRGETSPMRWVRFGSGRASLNPRLNGDIQALIPMIIGQ